jgi:hypothetical protein
VVVTADALQPHPDAAQFLVATKRGHYLSLVKANQQTCWTAASSSPGTASRWLT